MAVGDRYQGNSVSFIDEVSGYTIIKPIEQDENRHMYFTSNPFTQEGEELIVSAVRSGAENYYLLNPFSGEYMQLTDVEKESKVKRYCVDRGHFDKKTNILYYAEPNCIYSVNIRTLEHKTIYESDGALHSLSTTCDGRYLISCNTVATAMHNNDGDELSLDYYRMFKLDLVTGEETTILYRNFPFYHLQCSPTDPDFIMYCAWGYHCTHQRIWYTNIDGTKGGPLGPEMPNEHRVHEYITPDGKQVAYHGKFYAFGNTPGFKNINHTWGIMDIDGNNDKYWSMLPRPSQAGHSIMSHDCKMIVCDGGQNISFVVLNDDGTANLKPIVAHNSTKNRNFVHPHPSFCNNDRYIVYATDNDGQDRGNIYLVDLKSRRDK